MDLEAKKYLATRRKRFDPLALILSGVGIAAIMGSQSFGPLADIRSVAIVVGGTFASILFQYDITSVFRSFLIILRTFWGTPDGRLLAMMKQLDDAIVNQRGLGELREGVEVDGELLNDIVFMHRKGMLFEEIDEFVTTRVRDDFLHREIALSLLQRAAVVAPSLGLFGTVLGLIGVLQTLSSPAEIGPSMSLALMTTAYGAGLGSLVFSPLAGRVEHHNVIFLEVHKQLLGKVQILLAREERRMDSTHTPELAAS